MTSITLMAAVNGARKMPSDHPRLPVTVADIARDCADCARAGASAAHVHVRDAAGHHVLDAGLYREAIASIRAAAGPELVIQATTEAVGRYSPAEQMALVRDLRPEAVSIAVKELIPDDGAKAEAAAFYGWCRDHAIAVQHILYSSEELERFLALMRGGTVPRRRQSVLFVLGRYASDQESRPVELLPFVEVIRQSGRSEDFAWMCCAFGRAETAVMAVAAGLGGHCRVGFENNFRNADGGIAQDNAERIAEVSEALRLAGRMSASREQALVILGKP